MMNCAQCRGSGVLFIPDRIKCGMCGGSGKVESNQEFFRLHSQDIKKHIEENRLTLLEMAETLSMDDSNLCKALKGRTSPFKTVQKFREVVGE